MEEKIETPIKPKKQTIKKISGHFKRNSKKYMTAASVANFLLTQRIK